MRLKTLLACLSLLLPGLALADDTMRCGNRLVSTGDGKDKVRTLCGEPTDVAFVGTIKRRGYYNEGPYDYSFFGPAWIEQPDRDLDLQLRLEQVAAQAALRRRRARRHSNGRSWVLSDSCS